MVNADAATALCRQQSAQRTAATDVAESNPPMPANINYKVQ